MQIQRGFGGAIHGFAANSKLSFKNLMRNDIDGMK